MFPAFIAAVGLAFGACSDAPSPTSERALSEPEYVTGFCGAFASFQDEIKPHLEDQEVLFTVLPGAMTHWREDLEALKPPQDFEAIHERFVSMIAVTEAQPAPTVSGGSSEEALIAYLTPGSAELLDLRSVPKDVQQRFDSLARDAGDCPDPVFPPR